MAVLVLFLLHTIFLHYYHSKCLKHIKSFHLFLFWHHLSFFTIIWRTMHRPKKITIWFFFLDNKEQGLALLIYKQKRVSFVLLVAKFIWKVENWFQSVKLYVDNRHTDVDTAGRRKNLSWSHLLTQSPYQKEINWTLAVFSFKQWTSKYFCNLNLHENHKKVRIILHGRPPLDKLMKLDSDHQDHVSVQLVVVFNDM